MEEAPSFRDIKSNITGSRILFYGYAKLHFALDGSCTVRRNICHLVILQPGLIGQVDNLYNFFKVLYLSLNTLKVTSSHEDIT